MLVITETRDDFGVRPSMRLLKAAVDGAKVPGVEFLDAEDRSHISIVTNMARPGDDPARDAIVRFVRKRCDELK